MKIKQGIPMEEHVKALTYVGALVNPVMQRLYVQEGKLNVRRVRRMVKEDIKKALNIDCVNMSEMQEVELNKTIDEVYYALKKGV